ncbi:MAG: hypothetical protein IRY96_05900 [Burkholderiales bacterium]|mgnify:CR=1 FL=1|nr:hypothetical protein [Burkholderiales bacterium]
MRRSAWCWALALLLVAALARADEVETVQLRHRTAAQLIPVLQPMLEPGGALSGIQSTLIIRSSRDNIEDLKRIIATLDTAPRRLLISVRQDASFSGTRSDIGVSGTFGGDVRVGVNEAPRRETGASVRVLDSVRAGDERNVSQVQAVEGSPAYIAVGQSIPVPVEQVRHTPYGREVVRSVEYRDVNTGFYVVPHLSGEHVVLEIEPQRERPGAYGPGSTDVQRIATTVSARLGEWIELGGFADRSVHESNRILSSRSSGARGGRSVWVKVEALP